jgi:hypothetical protein
MTRSPPLRQALLLALLLGCTPDPADDTGPGTTPGDSGDGHTGESDLPDETGDSLSGETGDSLPGETGDTGDVDPDDYWASFEWTGVSDLDIVLDLDVAPQGTPHWEVRICESAEWWGRGCEDYTTIAHSFSSLDGLLTEDGFILAGVPDGLNLVDYGFRADFRELHFLSTPDMEHWGTHIEPITGADEHARVVDPAMVLQADGQPSFVYYELPMSWEDDPASYHGPHDIPIAQWNGEAFERHPEVLTTGPDLADPTVLVHDGLHHMFTTCGGDICHATSEDGLSYEHDDSFYWGGAQVPHANDDGEQLMVVGQGGGGWPPPRYLFMNEDGSFPSSDEQLWSDEENLSFFGGSCTSPVLVYWNETYYTICTIVADAW